MLPRCGVPTSSRSVGRSINLGGDQSSNLEGIFCPPPRGCDTLDWCAKIWGPPVPGSDSLAALPPKGFVFLLGFHFLSPARLSRWCNHDQTVISNVLTFSNLNSRLDSFEKKRGELPIVFNKNELGNESEDGHYYSHQMYIFSEKYVSLVRFTVVCLTKISLNNLSKFNLHK